MCSYAHMHQVCRFLRKIFRKLDDAWYRTRSERNLGVIRLTITKGTNLQPDFRLSGRFPHPPETAALNSGFFCNLWIILSTSSGSSSDLANS